MLHEFIETHRDTLVERCRLKAGRRPVPATPGGDGNDAGNGIPSFVGQLIDTLRLERFSPRSNNRVVTGPWGPVARDLPSEIASVAAKNGNDMLRQGFTVAQVVDDYGDLCQAVMELAIENGVSISAREFLTLNRSLDVAMASAVTEFSRQRDRLNGEAADRTIGERLGHLAHDLPIGLSLADARPAAATAASAEDLDLDAFIAEFQSVARVEAAAHGGKLVVTCEPDLGVHADKQMLLSAVSSLLQNAFRFARAGTVVTLEARSAGERVLIEVEDRCGGLPVARRAAEAGAGSLRVPHERGLGCVFTIDLPRVRRCTDGPGQVG